MKRLSAAGIAVGLLALLLAPVGCVATPEGVDGVRAELGALRKQLAKVSSSPGDEVLAELEELRRRLEKVSGEIELLDGAVARAADRPAAGAAREAGLSEARVREIVREMIRARLARSRGAGGQAGTGGEAGRGARAGRGGRGMIAGTLAERIGLDEEKAEKIALALRKMGEDMRDIWRENRGGGREQIRELMRELREKSEGEIAKLLTPEELEKFREWRTETRRRWGGGRSGRRGRRNRGGGGGEEAGEPQAF